MENHNALVEKYPQLKEDLDRARELQDMTSSVTGRALYKQKQMDINALIPKIIELARVWDENELRYTIAKMELLREEIMSMENNAKAYEALVGQINSGDFDKETTDE